MNTSKLTALSLIATFLIPAGSSFAASSAIQAYDEIRGPFATQEAAEAACMKAVGLDEETIQHYTGNIGNLWDAGNPLRFFVRRCLNNVKKESENRALALRREGRKLARIEKYISPRSRRRIEQNDQYVRDRTYDNVRTRASQQTRSSSERLRVYARTRYLRRQKAQAEERDINSKLDRKVEFKKEAEVACKNMRGMQRVMCIRKEVREREEELYDE